MRQCSIEAMYYKFDFKTCLLCRAAYKRQTKVKKTEHNSICHIVSCEAKSKYQISFNMSSSD